MFRPSENGITADTYVIENSFLSTYSMSKSTKHHIVSSNATIATILL